MAFNHDFEREQSLSRGRQGFPGPDFEFPPAEQTQIDGFIDNFHKIMETAGEQPSLAISQQDGYSDAAEATRDEIIARLSRERGFDVEADMNAAERDWRAKDGKLLVEPWMKKALGMDNHDQPVLVNSPKTAYRSALLGIESGREYWLIEHEIPNVQLGQDGATERVNRIMYFKSMPFQVA